MGCRVLDAGEYQEDRIPAITARDLGNRACRIGARPRYDLGTWVLGLAAGLVSAFGTLCMAAGILVAGANQLDLDAGPLRVHTSGMRFCVWVLGLYAGATWRGIFADIFSDTGVCTYRIPFFSEDCHQREHS